MARPEFYTIVLTPAELDIINRALHKRVKLLERQRDCIERRIGSPDWDQDIQASLLKRTDRQTSDTLAVIRHIEEYHNEND